MNFGGSGTLPEFEWNLANRLDETMQRKKKSKHFILVFSKWSVSF